MDFLRDGYDAELTPGEMIDFFCVDSDSVIDRCNLSGPQTDQVVAWFDEMHTAVGARADEGCAMKVVGVNHLQVNVTQAELPAAREFYLGFLGMKEIERPPVFKSDGFWFHAGEREMHIGVEENIDRRATRAHVAYEVTDLAGWRKKIEAARLPIKDQPRIPGYERFHFRDPFGNNVELIERI